jgi:hypothetical protein
MSILAITEICNLFPEVRSFEAFTHLDADIISGSNPSLHLVTNTPKQRNSKA